MRIVVSPGCIFVMSIIIIFPLLSISCDGYITYSEATSPILIKNGTQILFWKIGTRNNNGANSSSGFFVYDVEKKSETYVAEYLEIPSQIAYLENENICIVSSYHNSKLVKLNCTGWSMETIYVSNFSGIAYLSVSSMGFICFSTNDLEEENYCLILDYLSNNITEIFSYNKIINPIINHKYQSIFFSSGNMIYSYHLESSNISTVVSIDGIVNNLKLTANENELLFTSGNQKWTDRKKIFKLNLTSLEVDTFFEIPSSHKSERGIMEFDLFPNHDSIVVLSYEPYGFGDVYICNMDGSNWTKISNIDQPEPWEHVDESSIFCIEDWSCYLLIIVIIGSIAYVLYRKRQEE